MKQDLSQDTELLHKLFSHTLSNDPKLRAAAYLALSNFTPEDSILSCLLAGLEDPAPEVRKAAGSVLIQFGCYDRSDMHSHCQ